MNFKFSKHASEQLELRGIPKEVVEKILANPEQIREEEGNKVYQSFTEDRKHVIRIFVNDKKNPNLVLTVYKTSKTRKYYESKI